MSISSVNGVASTVSRYRFVAAGGETSLTGSDANGATLSYLVGKEEVYLNGALLVRGQDYTGTDGATISSLTALVAGDTVEIITFVPFAIPTAISSATVTTQGDLIVATGASAVTRLGVGSSGQILTSNGTTPAYTSTVTGTLNNGTLTGTLTAASSAGTSGQLLSSTGTGVQWVAAPAAGSMTVIASGSLSGTVVNITSVPQTYKQLAIYVDTAIATGSTLQFRFNSDSSSKYYSSGTISGSATVQYNNGVTAIVTSNAYTTPYTCANYLLLTNYTSTTAAKIGTLLSVTPQDGTYMQLSLGLAYNSTSAITTINIGNNNNATLTGGTYVVYGVN